MKYKLILLVIALSFGCNKINLGENMINIEIFPTGSLEEYYKCELKQNMLLEVSFGRAQLENNSIVLGRVIEMKNITLKESVFKNILKLSNLIYKKPSISLDRIRRGGWRVRIFIKGEKKVFYDFHKIKELGNEYQELVNLILDNSPLIIRIHSFS